jgi:NAD(P)-dependent dehydrogenase (short-subunit alcohol dehydrogenase family)
MDRLKDKVAIVTGGNSGIGEAIAETFAREGAKVIVASLGASQKDNIAKKLKEMGADYMILPCDISKEEDVKKVFDKVVKKYKRVDIMINNAGVLEKGLLPVDKFKVEDWEWVTRINTFGTMLCMKYASNVMLKQKSGSIVNVSSIAGAKGFGGSVYCSTKAAMLGLTRNSAMRFAGTGIRCNAICPGSVLTPMTTGTSNNLDPDMYTAMENYGNLQVGISKPEDIANVALFLASDESSAITGQELIVDKGYSL